jgi:TetR/AcrR family transcriptional regulator, transcriptional repressor of aconitase
MPKVSEQYSIMRRQQIIEAAYRCFARKGFQQATMRDIYQESGFSAGAVYHYFKSKEDIIEASFTFDYQRSLPAFEQAEQEADPLLAMQHLMDRFFHGISDASGEGALGVNIQGWAEALINQRLMVPLEQFQQDFTLLVMRLIEHGQATGVIRSDIDPKAAGQLLLSCFIGLYLQKAFQPELEIQPYKETVTNLLFHSLQHVV